MDIDLLSKMVKELILDNDRVVLPGLGSFVAEMVPSTFSDKGYTINPPYRRLFFRSKPDEGDMLVRFYAESNNVTPDLAERIIKDFISELRDVLHIKKTVLFPGLGRLRATKENNLFFVADEDLDIYPAGFGLEPISLKTHEEAPHEVAGIVEQQSSVIDVPEEPVSDDVDFTENELIDLNIEEDVIPEEWDGSDSVSEPEVAQTDEDDVTSDPEEVSELDSDSVQESESLETPEPEASPVPESENIAESEPEAAPVPESESLETPEPEASPVPESEDSLEAESVSESASESETEVVLESEQESEQSAAPVSAADSVSVLIPTESVNAPEKSLPVSKKPAEPSTSNKVLKAILISLICVFALAVIYMLVMRIFPDFMNNILYTPEELEIINFK